MISAAGIITPITTETGTTSEGILIVLEMIICVTIAIGIMMTGIETITIEMKAGATIIEMK